MDSSDKLVLGAAGKKATTVRKPRSAPRNRRSLKDLYSDDRSNSRNNDVAEGSSGKASGSRVRGNTGKRRLDLTERDDHHGNRQKMDGSDRDRDRDHDENPLAITLYKGGNDDHGTQQKMDESSVRDRRATQKTAERAGALAELDKRRSDRKSNSQIPWVSGGPLTLAVYGNPRGSGSGSHDVEGSSRRNEGGRRRSISGNSAVNNKPPTLAICGSTSRSRSGANDVNRELALNASDSDEEDIRSKTKVLTYKNIRDITIQRSTLEKWFTETFFEELIVGCFVRVVIGSSLSGPVYRLFPVRGVDTRGPDCTYEFDNKATNKYLNLVWGPDCTAKNWQMISVSNASPTKEEFDQWLSRVKGFGGYMPTKEQAREKRYAIHQRNLILENRAIVPMDKSSIVRGPSSIAAEKVRLRSELETVDDVVEVERIKTRLQELDAARLTERDVDAKALRLAEMNRKNKIENLRNAAEKKPVNANLKAGDPGYDPFSRRSTRSTNYFLAKSSTGGQQNDDATAAVADSSTGAGREAASCASKWVDTSAPSAQAKAASGSGKSVDGSAAVEQGTDSLHNFELSISLDALQKFRGPKGVKAGFMARKQRIEANLGRKVPEDDGQKHDRALTVTGYMKRRGLL
ncbi:UNVERIFIED_CONTAM: protein RTF1 [Sesamum radiatum]|uniref:Protein RTF1 n=1 Tax=Sesamum radiatum TaxID=300843 RepID=A0AAW2LSE6_SESRA